MTSTSTITPKAAHTTAPLQPQAAWQALHEASTAPYRRVGRFAWRFARGKLGRDPVFRSLLERGDLPPQARVLDIGCGQGLLASLLQACADLHGRGLWPLHWPHAPRATAYTGIELMPRDVDRARQALFGIRRELEFVCADMCQATLPACDLVVILDVLHYVDHSAQVALLARVRDALSPQGRLLLRVGDAASRRGFAVSQWVDRAVTLLRGHRAAPTWGRPLADWVELVQGLGFAVSTVPMSRGTPFANVMLVADRSAKM